MLNDRYSLGEVIGSGGMSEVYAAEDTSLGRSVAVKMLRPEMARDVNFRERFRREAQNSGKLNHPIIVQVFDTGEDMSSNVAIPYIVMERVNGRTLRDIITEDGPMTPEEAAEILKPVADALQASHEAGIIHRDVKPANIMLTNTGQVKVMDFGIARALDDSTSAMTQTSAVIGTAQYLSPEQARGKTADARSDVYALGCVLYESVTGRTPFEGETPFAVAYQHVQEDPVPPSEYIEELSPTQRVNIDAVVLTAMAKHPADRYQSAWEMAGDLERLSRGAVTQAARTHISAEDDAPTTITHAPVASTRSTGTEKSGSGLKWLAALLAAALIGTVGYFGWDFYQNSRDLKQQEADRRAEAARQANMVIIPEVENRPRAEVVKELEEMGLLVQVNQEPNDDVARDRAIRINPAAGSELQKNSTVILTVSSGKEITDVPDITGMNVDEATQALTDAGLELDDTVTEESNKDIPSGQIISQNPAGGSQLSKGSKVRITVSTGPEDVSVPDMKGLNVDDAKSTLEGQDLKVQIQMVDSTKPEGTVLSMPDTSNAKAGDTITLQVSNGMLIAVPDLVRMTESDAKSALKQLGWTGSFTKGEVVNTPVPTDGGRIAWSSAQSGQTIRKDADIQIREWKFLSDLNNTINSITNGGR
ncbi:Stk1 family PASTA domain-containing Ser/Thr kinase [Corynebacterium phoceense]|uniref:Stk1 family PASTA domain-containing Ser/Thr kinase n=1 Tax=Corynebacterium phoceense TaxID=1686286 RepID=UPI0034CFFE47